MATMAIAHQNHHLEQKKQHPGDFSTESDVGENWQNMMAIIKQGMPSLKAEEELEHLQTAETVYQAKTEKRDEILAQLAQEVTQLNKQAHAAARAAERPATHPTPAEHAEQVRLLEQQHQDVGRALSEMQSTVARKEAELARLRTEKEDIEKREVGADDWNNGEALKLKMFSGMGFNLVPSQSNVPPKVLIRNDEKDDINSVAVDKNRSKVSYANLIWSHAGA